MQTNGVQQQQASISSIKGMEAELYKAAISGSFEAMTRISNWMEQETLTENNVLHLHVAKPLLKKVRGLAKWDPMVYKEFIEKVFENDVEHKLLWKRNSNGDTPLHLAARFGHKNAVQAFLNCGDKVNQEEVRRLLKVINKKKDTPLHDAARADVVKMLVEADPNCLHHEPNDEGETPLYLAAERGCTSSVLSILDTCTMFDLAYKGPCGRTALHAAVQWGKPEIVSRMLEKDKMLMRIQDDEGLTPMHCVAGEIKRVQLLQILLNFDKDEKESSAVYIQDNMGRTPLHIAMLRRNMDALEKLIDSRPDCIETVDNNNQNVLHYAAKWTCLEVMHRLLRREYLILGKLINDKDLDGNTPLHILAASIPESPILHVCIKRMPYFAKMYPLLDLRVYNKQNLTVGDILLSCDSLLRQERLLNRVESGVIPRGRRINTYEKDVDIEKATMDFRFGEWDTGLLKKAAESRLVVAALIATVSFTAGFTVPGGFHQDPGKNMGMAVLKNKPAFIVFLISDTIAFTSSTLAIIFYFVLVSTRAKWAIQNISCWALLSTTVSLGAMMIAFLAGVTSVLSKSLGLIISIYAISAVMLYVYVKLIQRTFIISKYWVKRFHIKNHRVHQ